MKICRNRILENVFEFQIWVKIVDWFVFKIIGIIKALLHSLWICNWWNGQTYYWQEKYVPSQSSIGQNLLRIKFTHSKTMFENDWWIYWRNYSNVCQWGNLFLNCHQKYIRCMFIFKTFVGFISYSKCPNLLPILKLSSNFGCLFTFCYFARANWIKTKLQTCKLQTGQSISYKYVNQFWLNLPHPNSKN